MAKQRKMRVGMVGGGGPANFFGGPHRTAILMDNTAELAAGALRSSVEGSLASAEELHFTRGYPDFGTMMREEAALPQNERMDYVTIVATNDVHYPAAKAALEAGFPVLCEKPLTLTLEESRDLVRLAWATGLPFQVAYTYTGFPIVMTAREMVHAGKVGDVRKVEAWYPQGWLASRSEGEGRSEVWRVLPERAGASGCGGDIGTHAYEFVRFVAGRTAVSVQARLHTFIPGRPLEDDFTVLARLDNGGIATIMASQVTIGAQNDNGFRVIGDKGTLEWCITDFENLRFYAPDGSVTIYRRGTGYPYISETVHAYLRIPWGHPEGFHEALANLHRTMQWKVRRFQGEQTPEPFPHPDVVDGAAGMAFLEAAVRSSERDGAWTDVPSL